MILVAGGSPIRVFSGASYALADINSLQARGVNVKAAVASCTDEPLWARRCMDYLVAEDNSTLSQCFGNLVEISYGNKTNHFRRLHEKTEISFENMGR
jgi:hypothetical protein